MGEYDGPIVALCDCPGLQTKKTSSWSTDSPKATQISWFMKFSGPEDDEVKCGRIVDSLPGSISC